MKIIGLCGGSGSGKGAVCDIFRENGIPCVDTDAVYHELTGKPGKLLDALALEFGKDIITSDNRLNRRALAAIVFSGDNSQDRLNRLNAITHKHILDETRMILKRESDRGATLGVVDAPALFESGFDSECCCLVSVVADREARIERIIARDGISRLDAEKRIGSQISDGELISRTDYVIYNNSDLASLREQVEELIIKLKNNFER